MNEHIIGGMFGPDRTPGEKESLPGDLPPHHRAGWFMAARSALMAAAMRPGIARVWLPSYLCDSMLPGLESSGKEIRYFPVPADLRSGDLGWTRELSPADMVVVIAYYGVQPPPDLTGAIRDRRGYLVLDESGCPPTAGTNPDADSVVYSPRKLAGVPAGGILVDLSEKLAPFPTPIAPPAELADGIGRAFDLRGRFDDAGAAGSDRRWYAAAQDWERTYPAGLWGIDERSRRILADGLPWSAIAARRRANHAFLADALRSWRLTSLAEDSTCPLGYVLALDAPELRDGLRSALIAGSIYPPIHWALPPAVPSHYSESHDLSARTLTLACDQRYDFQDMERIAACVARFLREAA